MVCGRLKDNTAICAANGFMGDFTLVDVGHDYIKLTHVVFRQSFGPDSDFIGAHLDKASPEITIHLH